MSTTVSEVPVTDEEALQYRGPEESQGAVPGEDSFVAGCLRAYIAKACEQVCFAGVKAYGDVVKNLASDRLFVIDILRGLTESDKLALLADEEIIRLRVYCRALVQSVIDEERERLIDGEIHPKLVWFLLDIQQRLAAVLCDNQALSKSDDQWKAVEYIHSQQLALALFARLSTHLTGVDKLHLIDVGSKTGDLISRLLYELRGVGKDVDAEAYDIETGLAPLAPAFADECGQPLPQAVPVEYGDLLSLSDVAKQPADLLLLSNILHKIDPGNHEKALDEAGKCLKPGGLLVINTPYFSRRDPSVFYSNFYRTCDTTSSTEALLAWDQWKALVSGREDFEVVAEHDIGFEGSLLDGFCHRALVLRRIS